MIKLPERSIELFSEQLGEIFQSGELAEGKWSQKTAEWVSSYTTAKHALVVNSNGAGLFALLKILNRYRGYKSVFLQSNTMYGVKTIAISSGLDLCGYVNCSLDYLMPTYSQVKEFIERLDKSEETVLLLTHIGGWVNPDIEKISEICKKYGVALIEDCAHSLGSTLNGKHTGLFGDAGVYSLYATKAIPVGEGGIIVTNDIDLYEMVSKFVIYDRFDQKLDVGINIRMSEINALLAYSVLKETESIIENKHNISEKYESACIRNGIEIVKPRGHGQRSNLYKFILLSCAKDPIGDFSLITKRTSAVYDYALGEDPEEICNRHICLPIWYLLESDVVNDVVNELNSYCRR